VRKLHPDWVCNLGEIAHHILYHWNKITKKHDIIVVCEQTFFVVNETGHIRYQRRLEYTPSCVKPYHLPGANKDIFEFEGRQTHQVLQDASQNKTNSPCFSFILGSFSNYLMVYKDVQLVWTAKTPRAPIYVNVAKFEGREGLIVTLADNGWLQVSYLGTEPPA